MPAGWTRRFSLAYARCRRFRASRYTARTVSELRKVLATGAIVGPRALAIRVAEITQAPVVRVHSLSFFGLGCPLTLRRLAPRLRVAQWILQQHRVPLKRRSPHHSGPERPTNRRRLLLLRFWLHVWVRCCASAPKREARWMSRGGT